MGDDRREQGEEALAKLRRAIHAQGAELPVPSVEPSHAGFAEGETYVDPGVGPGVTYKYPILEDTELPGTYKIIRTLPENRVRFVLRASDGLVVATIFCRYNDEPLQNKGQQVIRIYHISEAKEISATVAQIRSKLNMRRFASAAAAFARDAAGSARIYYKAARPGEYL